MAWFAAGALGESAPPDIGSRIMVGPSVEPVSDELGGVRVDPDDGATIGTAPEPLTATSPTVAPAPAAPPPAPPAPPPPDDDGPGDDDDDDDDGPEDDGPGDGDDDASDG
ncbi:MAG: hypothetical protein H0V38_07940 [Sporichthyaceae bacterium]|nr:hypothetical protein [Sporichthyaceae bacterium]